ncbi:sensor histidine kinase [Lactobacillus taiwanensis]|uniref:sensor histidine kinase n=1 Tax=Lactobacillus taiwanensis TaxID=508451 RepID=UPI0024316402|nr:sensor histidine kinase [Lactobacillus taiwanensis]
MKFKYLVSMRHFMVTLNFIIVSFIGAQFLLITQYILNHQLSSELLTTLARVPASPMILFSECIISYGLLVLVMYILYHHHFSTQNTLLLLILEFVLAFAIFFAVRMNYNGIFLLVFIDLLLTYRNLPTIQNYCFWGISGIIFLLLFSFSNYSLLGVFFKMPSLTTYLNFLPTQSRSLLVFFNNFLVSLNLITFICICLGYVIYILNRTHTVQSKLHSMQKANDELKSYAAISEKIAQDHERKRIARDIHDTVGHTLTGVAAGIDAAMVLIDIDPKAAKTQLQKISAAIKQGIKEVRQVLNQLRPDALKSYTLASALNKMLKEYSDISHIQINFNYAWGDADFQKTTENIIFRVIEETVTNSLRHGHATEIWIDCTSNDSFYILSIHNNGKSETKIKPGYGITQMKERLAIINGTVEFDGKKGFTTSVKFPKVGV